MIYDRVELQSICNINMGQSPDSGSYNQENDGIPFFQGNADFGDMYPVTRMWCSKPIKIANEGDLLLSVRAPIGALNFATEECCIGRGLAAISPVNEKINIKYIYYALKSMKQELDNKGTGSTFKAINKGSLSEVKIPNIDISEQNNCVEKLDRVGKVTKHRKKQLHELDDLIKSRFVEMFGDPVLNEMGWALPLIEDVVAKDKNALKAGPFGSALKKEFYVESGFKIYGQEQVISGDSTFGNYYIDRDRYKSLENCAVQAGDVLISLVGTYGKLLILPEEFEAGIINPRLMKITFDKEKVNPFYFQHYFQSDSLKRALAENTHGGTMDILNLGIVRKLAMPLPPLKLQNEFADFVQATDKLKSEVEIS
ncbi:restriction endonuclease subunit S [Konateibacter massiliensis]|uniref:restriction endonuclease subunit S n=1 Tax=Konateibacter massiliensis TaxID=2002841 RepID=UPI0015D4BF82|nr:restriction endonuclease subunit S [Konateibacter massiliensis]